MSEISKQRLEEISKLAKTGNFVPYDEHVPGGVKIEGNIPFKDLKQDFKSFSTSPVNIEVGDIFKGVPDSKYDKNIPLDVLTEQGGLAKWRAQSQPWYEQTGAFIGQAVIGEILGGTIMSVGALVEAPEMIYNYLTGEKNTWDNAIFELGKGISDYSREAMPIYQTGERFGDWGWYMQGLTSSVSAVSMMVPGMAVSKGIGWVAKAMKLAATPSAVASTLLGAGAMRHSENFREAAELYQSFQLTPEEQETLVNKYKPAMEEEMMAAGVIFDPENPQAATQENIARQEAIRTKYAKLLEEDIEAAKQMGTAMAYNANWINYGFDVLQLGAVLRPFKALTRGGSISGKVAAAHDATVTGTKLVPKSWAGRVGQRIWDPAKVGLSEWTEGVEELINSVSSIEGERAARIQLGVEKDDGSNITSRVLGYLGEQEVQDAFIWGMVGGVMFKGASRAIGMDAGTSINNRKLAEIANRSEHLKAYNSNISAIRNGEKLADMEGNVIADYSKLTPEEKIREEELVIERMGFDKGLRSSQAGTMDIDTQWARDPKTAKTFIDMGMADETNVSERINKFVQQMENAEKIYQKHYMNLFESPITQTAKSILIQQNVVLDQQLQQNQAELQSLQTNYNKILASDPFLVQNANNPDVMNSIKLLALQMAEVSLREAKAVNKSSEFITKAIDESLANMSEIKKQYTTAKPVSLGNINMEVVKNLAKTQVLTAYNEGINNELIRRADKKNITKEAAKIDKEVELQKEAVNKRAQELKEKETLNQEKALKDLGYTKAQIDRMPTKKRQEIIEQAKVEEQTTTPIESVVEPTEPTAPITTEEVDWNNLIVNAVNERELDAIIDQMTEAGVEPDFTAINKRREELTIPITTTPVVSEETTEESGLEPDNTDLMTLLNLPTDIETFEDGNTPPLSDKDIENIEDSINEEMESITPQMKRVNAIGIINLVRRHKQTTTGEKFSTTDEVLNPEALLLSSWKYFNPGDEVIVSVDTEYNGEVNTYTDDRQRLTKDGEAITERRTYGQLKADPDNLPIKVELKRGDVTTKVGYLPTTYWVGEKNVDGSYANIADEMAMEGNGDAQVEQMQQLRREIAAIEHGAKLSFKVTNSTPGSLFLTSKRVNGAREKNPISVNMPTFLELPIWNNTPGVAPFTVFNKGFMINKDVRFPANMTIVKPENVDEVFPPGTTVMMVPSANPGVFIPRPVKLNRIQTPVAQGIAEVIKGYMTKNAEVAGKVFKTDQSIEGLKALKDYLEQFMYFSPIENVRKNTSIYAKVGLDMETGTLVISSSVKHAEVQLNRFREKDFSDPKVQEEFDKQITPLVEALTKLHITVRTTMINSQDKFFIPRVTKDGALDFTESTFNEYLSDNLLTDVLEKTTDEGEAIYAVQPVIEIKWDKEDKLDPKPKEPVQQTPDTPVIPTIDLSELDVSDIVGERDFAISISPNPTMSQLKTKLKGNGILSNRGVKKFATNLDNYNRKNGTSHQYKAIPIGESASYKIKLTLSNVPVNQWAKEQRDAIKRDDFGLTVGDYAIGVPQASKISELAYSYLVSDGEYTFTAEKQQAITSTITNSVFAKLLEAEEVGEQITVREAFDSAKKQFTNLLKGLNKVNTVATLENFKDVKPQLQSQGWGFIQSYEHLQFLIEEIGRVTKDDVFRQFTLQVQDNLRKLDITAREEETSLDAEGNETTLERTWEDGAYLKMFAKDSAVRKVKLALGKIRDTKLNYLGLPAYVPFDTVFDDIMSILSSKPIGNTIEQNSRVLRDIALNNPYKAYLSQVADLLDNPDVTQSIKNNFQSVIMRNNNDFVFLIWNKGDRGWSFKPMDANRNNVVSRIVDSWNENFVRSPLVKEVNGEKVLDKQAVKDKGYTIEDVKKLDTLEKKKTFTERLFLDLGLGIDPTALEKLFNSLNLAKDFGKGFPGGFGAQFGFTAKNEPNGLISSLVHALNVEQAVEEGDSLFEVNNPFVGKNSERAAKYLAGIAANYSELIYSDSHRNINGDTVNNYAFYTPETLRIKAIHNPEVRARLRTQAITHNSFFLRELDRGKEIKYHLEDGMRQEGRPNSGVGRGKMSPREQRLLAIGLFQQINPQYVGLTHSDKSLTPIVSAPKIGLSISSEYVTIVDGIPQISVEALPNRVRAEIQELIIAERNRIREIGDKIRELGEEGAKRELGEQYFEGSQYFYFFPELNNIVRENGVVSLAQLNNLDTLVDSAMGTMVDTINDTIKEWYEDGTVYYYTDNKNPKNSGWRTRFNQAYVNSTPKYTNLPFESMVAHAAVDMDINYAIFNANMMSVVQGDPAQTFKKSKKKGATAIDHVETTLEEYQKREAKDMAPGALGYWGWSTKVGGNVYKAPSNYGVAYINDVTYGTLMDGYLSTLEAYTGKLDRTDAQELTTVEEHIDVMFSYGKIPDNIYQSVKAKILANKGGMYKLTPEEKRFVLQPMKPVQIVRTWNPTFGIEETHYIKSSSFPLLPELVAGTDLDAIRKAMETSASNSNRGVQRLAYKTAVKVGHKRLNTLFDSKGVVNETVEFTDDDIVVLDREGFFIQQEVPYKEGEHRIVTGSQMNKLLFQGLGDNLTFNFQDKEYTTKQLKAIKESVRVELFKMSEREIHNKLGMELVDGIPTFTNLAALRESLIDEAKKRGWGLNDIDALRIVDGAVVIPFAFNNSAPRIESMILSIFNGIVKQKMNGKSLVQGTDVGLRQTREFNEDVDTIGGENGIVLIRDGNGKLLFDRKKGLQYADISKEGVKLAQVFMPWKYEGELKNFINDKRELDTSKIDPELLKQIGFRIPTQGHSSMLMIQVVGFLPKEMGDLVLVPGEITKQMGSDFDVDKLFNYIYNAVLSDEGNLIRVPNEKVVKVDEAGNVEVDRKELRLWIKQTYNTRYKNGWAIADKVSEYLKDTDTPLTSKEIVEGWANSGIKFTTVGVDSLEARAMQELGLTPDKVDLPSSRAIARQALENAYIGIHESVLSHPEVIKKSTQPLDRDDLKDTGTAYTTSSKKPIFISRKRQLDDYLMQRAGKEGVGVYSRAVTGAAVIEGFNVRLVTAFDGFDGYSLQKLSGNGTSFFNDNKKLVRTKVDNLVTQQSGAVDNAKTPVLDMNNLNMQTFNVAIILSMLEDSKGKALDLRYNSYFLRQEIIKDYVKEMQNISDSLNDEFGEGTRQEQVIDALREKYLSRIDTKVYKRKKKSFTLKELTDMLMAENTNTVEYIEGQLEVLERFSELDKIGKEYSDFLTAISTDSKGFGKSFWEVAKRREQLDRVYDFKLIEGLQEVIETGEHGTIAGYVRQVADNMGQLFPYDNPNITSIIKIIEQQSGKDDYIDVEFRERVWSSLKSFIFTDKELDLSTDRNELFYGENSVAKQVIKAKESWGMNNLFLNKLSPVLAKKQGMPDLVNFAAAIVERTDEINVVRAFTDLLVSSNEEARNLGENLIKYAYAKGGIQEALQFIKYIPTAYLATTNFANRIGISLNQVEQIRFIEQFYQHYPQYSPKYNQDIKLDKEGNLIVNIKESDTLQDKLYLAHRDTKAKEWLLFKRVKLEGNKAFYQRIPLLGGRGKNYTAYNEYNYNSEGVQVSTIPTNNPKDIANAVEPTTNPAVNTTEDRIVVKNTSVMDNRVARYQSTKTGPEGVKELVGKLDTLRYKLLGEIFSEAASLFPTFSFSINSKLTNAEGAPVRGMYDKGKLVINPTEIKNYYELEGRKVTKEDVEGVMMHELTHAVTSELYNAYTQGKSHPLLTDAVKKRFDKLATLFKVSTSKLTKEERAIVNAIATGKVSAISTNSAEQQRLIQEYYGFTNGKEFMSEATSNPTFQRKLNEIQFKEDKTLLDRFLQLLSNLFKEIGAAIGMDVNQQSVLAHTITEIVALTETISKESKAFTKPKSFKDQINDFTGEDLAVSVKSTNLQSSVSEFMQSLNKVEREALRSLMTSKDIIFKCK